MEKKKEKIIRSKEDWEFIEKELTPKRNKLGTIQNRFKIGDDTIGVLWEIDKTKKYSYSIKGMLFKENTKGWRMLTEKEYTFKKGKIESWLADNVTQIVNLLKTKENVVYLGADYGV